MRSTRTLLAVTPVVLLFAAAPAGAAVSHTVQPGETLWSIAAANNLTTRTVATFNGLPETSNVVLGSTIQVPTTVEGASALINSGVHLEGVPPQAGAPASSGAPAPAPATSTAAPAAPSAGAPPAAPAPPARGPRRSERRRPARGGRLRSALRGHALGPRRQLGRERLADRGGQRARPVPPAAGRDRAQAALGLAYATAGVAARARAAGRARRRARAHARARRRLGHPVRGRRERRLPLARSRNRVAGERVQQRHGVLGQRARRDAGHAGDLGLRREQPGGTPARRQFGDGQRQRRRALPAPPAQGDRWRRVSRDRRLLPGPGLRALARALRRHPALRRQRAGAALALRGMREGGSPRATPQHPEEARDADL